LKRHDRAPGKRGKALFRKTFFIEGFLFFLTLILTISLVSCASSPRRVEPHEPEQDDFSLLPSGGLLYFAVDVPRARPLLDLISLGNLSGKDVPEALDRTGSAVVAVYPEGESRRFLAALRGSYPRFRTGLSLAFSSAWKRARSETGDRYWRSSSYGVSIALTADRALVSDGDPFFPPPEAGNPAVIPQGGPPGGPQGRPQGLAELRRDALLAGWLEEAGTPVNQFFARLEIPLQIPAERVLFGVYAVPQGYEGTLHIETPSVNQAKAVASIISLARLFMAPAPGAEGPLALASALFAKPPVQEGSTLIIHTGVMDAREIALLFDMFLVYSKEKE
jgi:hypothetical protein